MDTSSKPNRDLKTLQRLVGTWTALERPRGVCVTNGWRAATS